MTNVPHDIETSQLIWVASESFIFQTSFKGFEGSLYLSLFSTIEVAEV